MVNNRLGTEEFINDLEDDKKIEMGILGIF